MLSPDLLAASWANPDGGSAYQHDGAPCQTALSPFHFMETNVDASALAANAFAAITLAATALVVSRKTRPSDAPCYIWWPWRSPFGGGGRHYVVPPYAAPALLSAAARRRPSPLATAAWTLLALNILLYPINAFRGQIFINIQIIYLNEEKKRRLFAELRATLYVKKNEYILWIKITKNFAM